MYMQIVVFTLEDEQIVWTDKLSDVKLSRLSLSVCVSVFEDDFSKTIYGNNSSKVRPKFAFRRTNG